MKFLITTICILGSLIHLSAQEDSVSNLYIHDAGLTIDYQFRQRDLINSPYISLKHRKHLTELGPILTILKDNEPKISLNGLRWRYAYNIYSPFKKLEIFLQTTAIYQLSRKKGQAEYFDLSNSSFKSYTFTSSNRELEFYVGYSMNYYLGKKIKLTHSLSYGIIKTKQKFKNELNQEQHSENFGALMAGLGVGYIINK